MVGQSGLLSKLAERHKHNIVQNSRSLFFPFQSEAEAPGRSGAVNAELHMGLGQARGGAQRMDVSWESGSGGRIIMTIAMLSPAKYDRQAGDCDERAAQCGAVRSDCNPPGCHRYSSERQEWLACLEQTDRWSGANTNRARCWANKGTEGARRAPASR